MRAGSLLSDFALSDFAMMLSIMPLVYDAGSGILLTDMDVGNAGVAGAFTCHDPKCEQRRPRR
jgi:hypothetical protein